MSKEETAIVFDWDDTLLASSFLASKGYYDQDYKHCSDTDTQLQILEKTVEILLTKALGHGSVFIVTNSETGWVEQSAEKFFPSLKPLLEYVTIISACSSYCEEYPNSPFVWKLIAFRERIVDASMKHIISIGDSHAERDAVRTVLNESQNLQTKSVKLLNNPSATQLHNQLEFLNRHFNPLCLHKGNLDLMIVSDQSLIDLREIA